MIMSGRGIICSLLLYGTPERTRTSTPFQATEFEPAVSTSSTTGAFGADERTRTSTPFRATPSEDAVSTNSTTSACGSPIFPGCQHPLFYTVARPIIHFNLSCRKMQAHDGHEDVLDRCLLSGLLHSAVQDQAGLHLIACAACDRNDTSSTSPALVL